MAWANKLCNEWYGTQLCNCRLACRLGRNRTNGPSRMHCSQSLYTDKHALKFRDPTCKTMPVPAAPSSQRCSGCNHRSAPSKAGYATPKSCILQHRIATMAMAHKNAKHSCIALPPNRKPPVTMTRKGRTGRQLPMGRMPSPSIAKARTGRYSRKFKNNNDTMCHAPRRRLRLPAILSKAGRARRSRPPSQPRHVNQQQKTSSKGSVG